MIVINHIIHIRVTKLFLTNELNQVNFIRLENLIFPLPKNNKNLMFVSEFLKSSLSMKNRVARHSRIHSVQKRRSQTNSRCNEQHHE